jgi:hypothetical protein
MQNFPTTAVFLLRLEQLLLVEETLLKLITSMFAHAYEFFFIEFLLLSMVAAFCTLVHQDGVLDYALRIWTSINFIKLVGLVPVLCSFCVVRFSRDIYMQMNCLQLEVVGDLRCCVI